MMLASICIFKQNKAVSIIITIHFPVWVFGTNKLIVHIINFDIVNLGKEDQGKVSLPRLARVGLETKQRKNSKSGENFLKIPFCHRLETAIFRQH